MVRRAAAAGFVGTPRLLRIGLHLRVPGSLLRRPLRSLLGPPALRLRHLWLLLSRRARLTIPSRTQLDGGGDQRKTKHNRIGAEPLGQHQGSDEGSADQKHAVNHRCKTAEDEPPAAVIDIEAQRRAQHQSTRENSPGTNEKNETQYGDARPQERDDGSNDVDDALKYQKPPFLVLARGAHRRDDGEDTVDEGVCGKYQYQRQHCYAGLEDRDQAKNNAEHAAYREGPPILRQKPRHLLIRRPAARA